MVEICSGPPGKAISFEELGDRFRAADDDRLPIERYYFLDEGHWTATGHELVADATAASLLTRSGIRE